MPCRAQMHRDLAAACTDSWMLCGIILLDTVKPIGMQGGGMGVIRPPSAHLATLTRLFLARRGGAI